ncbi:hypothetical protein Mp_4g15900 [Marchantia polymorpha subsp. ruderalis]|uniref:Uncharacterized protein n=2 Tax=Marchantia polymorpha TaxID=3197 RepID=A0AAF6BAC3_MARPO|nr:hypothetical protein MARPO_0054s0055 [Marchantia polymorpha]BBN08957.1 hypothetical protein Mp_4g15900 [Marchantia polymorpha subsp. ruderalis]|eukprot:PTQ37943.1 hypothetical protein MARPO_0054s0055 [Marchantia polymorpha]
MRSSFFSRSIERSDRSEGPASSLFAGSAASLPSEPYQSLDPSTLTLVLYSASSKQQRRSSSNALPLLTSPPPPPLRHSLSVFTSHPPLTSLTPALPRPAALHSPLSTVPPRRVGIDSAHTCAPRPAGRAASRPPRLLTRDTGISPSPSPSPRLGVGTGGSRRAWRQAGRDRRARSRRRLFTRSRAFNSGSMNSVQSRDDGQVATLRLGIPPIVCQVSAVSASSGAPPARRRLPIRPKRMPRATMARRRAPAGRGRAHMGAVLTPIFGPLTPYGQCQR